jgi:hypothetical protein
MSDTPHDRKSVQPFIKASRRSEILAKLAAHATSLALASSFSMGVAQAGDKSEEVAKGHAEALHAGHAPKARVLRPGILLASDSNLPSAVQKQVKEGKDHKDVKDVKDVKDTKDVSDTKKIKEVKDGKDGKDFKDVFDGKLGKDGKDDKERKEDKEAKEDKDVHDGKADSDVDPSVHPGFASDYSEPERAKPPSVESAPTAKQAVLRLDGALLTPLDHFDASLKPSTLLMRKPIL